MKDIIIENIKYIKQTFKLAKSDLIKTYNGAALGPLWALVKPTLLIFVYWFAFKYGLRRGGKIDGHEFVLWLIVGNLPWLYISEILVAGANSIRSNKHLVTKMPFPMSTIMSFVSLSKLLVHLALAIIVIFILLLNGYRPTVYWIQLLYYVPAMYLFFTALSWITAPLSSLSKDFLNLIKSIVTALFWLSGVLWNPYDLAKGPIQAIILMNPITYFINGYRNTLLFNKWFFETKFETLSFILLCIFTMYVGALVYRKTNKEIRDVL